MLIKETILSWDQALAGSAVSIFEGISMLKPSAAVDMSIPGICECQWSSFKSFWPCTVKNKVEDILSTFWMQASSKEKFKRHITWWTKRSCGGKSVGALTCSFVLALNSASSSSSLSSERSHTLKNRSEDTFIKLNAYSEDETSNHEISSSREVSYVSWLSDEVTANVEASCGLHSMDVIGCLW